MHLGRERERHLAAADQLEIDLGQDLAVEQRAVQRPARVVDAVVLAERIEADAGAGVAVARNLDRVDHRVGERGQLRLLELEVEKADVERRVVRDERRIADEAEELARRSRRNFGLSRRNASESRAPRRRSSSIARSGLTYCGTSGRSGCG